MGDDLALLKRYADSGDAEAMASVVRRYQDMVYGVCLRIHRDPHAAEESAQECMLRLMRSAGDVRVSLGGWLHRCATTVSLEALRRRRGRTEREKEYARMNAAGGESASWDEIAPYVDTALDELPDELRFALVEHFLRQRTQADIAEEGGVSAATISRRVDKGLTQLRTSLKRMGVVASAAALAGMLSTKTAVAAPVTLAAAFGKMAISGIGSGTSAAATSATAITGLGAAGLAKIAVLAAVAAAAGAALVLPADPLSEAQPDAVVRDAEALVALSPEEAAQETRAAIDAIRAQLARIDDMTCALVSHSTGTRSAEQIRNQIRGLEVLRTSQIERERAFAELGEEGLAEHERLRTEGIEQLQRELAEIRPYDRTVRSEWRVRSDGLVWERWPVLDDSGAEVGWTVHSYDGTLYTNYHDRTGRAHISEDGARWSNTNPEFGLTVYEERIDRFLERALTDGTISAERSRGANAGEGPVVITAVAPLSDDHPLPVWAKVWLDPQRGYMPQRVDAGPVSWRDGRHLTNNTSEVVAQELAPGIWYPVLRKSEYFPSGNVPDPDKPFEEWDTITFPSTSVYELRLEDVKINQGLTVDDFRIEFPEGTRVFDKRNEPVFDSVFGPVIEIVVNDDSVKQDSCVDLDVGKLFTLPNGLAGLEESREWCRGQGIDAFGDVDAPVHGLAGIDMMLHPFPAAATVWEMASANDVAKFWAFTEREFPTDGSVMGELPATFVFKTREGGIGMLVVVEFTDDPPGVRIRYKVVQPARGPALGEEEARPPSPADWSATDVAFAKAWRADLSYGVGEGRTQQRAIGSWEEFLRTAGISERQKLFALWRIASMCAYNSGPPGWNEKPDFARSTEAFRQARDLIPGLVSFETVNAATQHATQPGTPRERAARLAEDYRWFRTRTEEMLDASASLVGPTGSVINRGFYDRVTYPPHASEAERREELARILERGEATMVGSISGFLKSCTDEGVAAFLVASVEDVADSRHLETWRNVVSARRR